MKKSFTPCLAVRFEVNPFSGAVFDLGGTFGIRLDVTLFRNIKCVCATHIRSKNVHIMLTTRYEKCIMMETLTIDRGG